MTIKDFGSGDGTFLNGRAKLDKGVPVALAHGDTIALVRSKPPKSDKHVGVAAGRWTCTPRSSRLASERALLAGGRDDGALLYVCPCHRGVERSSQDSGACQAG